MSSANMTEANRFRTSWIPFSYNRNNGDPTTDPCGTAHFTNSKSVLFAFFFFSQTALYIGADFCFFKMIYGLNKF